MLLLKSQTTLKGCSIDLAISLQPTLVFQITSKICSIRMVILLPQLSKP